MILFVIISLSVLLIDFLRSRKNGNNGNHSGNN